MICFLPSRTLRRLARSAAATFSYLNVWLKACHPRSTRSRL